MTGPVTSQPLADGTWYFNLKTKDNAESWSIAGNAGLFVIDTTAPTFWGTTDVPLDAETGWYPTAPHIIMAASEAGIVAYQWDSSKLW